jgi:hypothetical protein
MACQPIVCTETSSAVSIFLKKIDTRYLWIVSVFPKMPEVPTSESSYPSNVNCAETYPGTYGRASLARS